MDGVLFPITYDDSSNATRQNFVENIDLYTRSMCDIMENDGETVYEKYESNLAFHAVRIESFNDTGKVSAVNNTVSFSFPESVASSYGSWECSDLDDQCAGFYAVVSWVSWNYAEDYSNFIFVSYA